MLHCLCSLSVVVDKVLYPTFLLHRIQAFRWVHGCHDGWKVSVLPFPVMWINDEMGSACEMKWVCILSHKCYVERGDADSWCTVIEH